MYDGMLLTCITGEVNPVTSFDLGKIFMYSPHRSRAGNSASSVGKALPRKLMWQAKGKTRDVCKLGRLQVEYMIQIREYTDNYRRICEIDAWNEHRNKTRHTTLF
jgi:hypothetical protein